MNLPDTSRLSFDNKKHAYKLDSTKLLSGVTTVISETSSKSNLIQWAANMAVDYVKENCEEREDVGSGPAPDYVYHASEYVLEKARTAHARKRDGAASKGTDTHALVELVINQCIQNDEGFVNSAFPWRDEVLPFTRWAAEKNVQFIAAEQRLFSEKYGYAGTADFVAMIDGKLTIGDLKTFPKMWSADAFIQCGAYANAWKELTGDQIAQSVVVKMCDPEDERLRKYGGKAFAVYPRYAIEEDEQMFLKRLDIYRYNQNFVSPKE